EEEEDVRETVVDDKLVVPPALAPSSPFEKTGSSSGGTCGENFTRSVSKNGGGGGSDYVIIDNARAVRDSPPVPGGGSEKKARVEERGLRVGADGGDRDGPTTSREDKSGVGKGGSAVQGLTPKVVAATLTTALSPARVANDGDEDNGGGGGGGGRTVGTHQAGLTVAAVVAAAAAAATHYFNEHREEEENGQRGQKKYDRAKSLPEVVETVSTTWRDLMSEDGGADTDCDDGEGVHSDVYYGAVSGASASGDIVDYFDGMSKRPWISPRGGTGPGPVNLETAGQDAFTVSPTAAVAGSSLPATQSSPLTAKFSRPLLSSSPLGSADTPPYLHHKRVPDVNVDERRAKRRSGGEAGKLIPPLAHVLSTEGCSGSDFESDGDGDEGYFSSSEKRTRAVFTSPIVSTTAGAKKTVARGSGKTDNLPTIIPSPSIRPGSGYATPKAGGAAAPTWAPSPAGHSEAIGGGLSYDSTVDGRSVAACTTTDIRRAVSSDQPHGTNTPRRTGILATGTNRAIDTRNAGGGGVPTRVPSPIERLGGIGSGLAPAAAVTAGVVAASAPFRRAVSSDEPHSSTSRRQARDVKAARVPSPAAARLGGIGSGLAPAATVTAGVVAASIPLRQPAGNDRLLSTPMRRPGRVVTNTGLVIEMPKAGVASAHVRSQATGPDGIGSGLTPAAAVTAGVVAASSLLRQAAGDDQPRSTLLRRPGRVATGTNRAIETQKAGFVPARVPSPIARLDWIGSDLAPAAAATADVVAATSRRFRRAASSDEPHSSGTLRRQARKVAPDDGFAVETPKAGVRPALGRHPPVRFGRIGINLPPAEAGTAAARGAGAKAGAAGAAGAAASNGAGATSDAGAGAAGAAAASKMYRRSASSDQPHSARRRRIVKDATGIEHDMFEAPEAEVRPALRRHPPVRFGRIGINLPPAEAGTAAARGAGVSAAAAGAAAASNGAGANSGAGAGAAGAAAASKMYRRSASSDQPHS
ncbi:unnamed protein product, partial [Laminaria digitata]